jgi:hypothetical protein
MSAPDEDQIYPYKEISLSQLNYKCNQLECRLMLIERENKLLAQDQYAKSMSGALSSFRDQLATVLMEWDEIIAKINARLKILESKK